MTSTRDKAIPTDGTSALERHIAYFSDNGVTYDSIRNKLLAMGESDEKASKTANVVSFAGGLEVKWCPYKMFQPKEAVGVLNHARDTTIYKLDGSIDEERWAKLQTYSEMDGEVAIITETKFYEFLTWCRDNDARWDVLGIAKRASNAEWEDFFALCTDYWKKTETDAVRSVTLATLRKFFDNSAEVFDRVVNKELPVQRSGM